MEHQYQTAGNLLINRSEKLIPYENAIDRVIDRLDAERGLVFSSNVEFPGRYTLWDVGLVNPPLVLNARGAKFSLEALNERGQVLLEFFYQQLVALPELQLLDKSAQRFTGEIQPSNDTFTEEMRSKQPSIFTVLRAITQSLHSSEDENLGLYGAFGYDLTFQFETVEQKILRDAEQRDLVLYLPDEIYIVDHRRMLATLYQYDFEFSNQSTQKNPRSGSRVPFIKKNNCEQTRSMQPGEYANIVTKAKEYFKRGDFFEVVPGQSFYHPCSQLPSEIFKRLRKTNPSPYSFIFNLGEQEFLVGASPEMFVRVTGQHVETRPISGTIKRGCDALADADNILKLLNSKKDECELTMCTDVDRNDKSRVCIPGSVQVTSRREIEKYSKLFHTVDHVEGELAPGYDALDAFLTHAWAVTVTGAPKHAAMQFIEDNEKSARNWYGGAIGWIHANGNMNTGLTLRTIHIKNGIAEVRAGATLLYDSDPIEEERETELKTSALRQVLAPEKPVETKTTHDKITRYQGKKILLVDHEDSFVNTLGNYVRQFGAEVTTIRHQNAIEHFKQMKPDLVLLSPGPGKPSDFELNKLIEVVLQHNTPLFGVCLGLQAIAEYFGGTLQQLETPMHGKPSEIQVIAGAMQKTFPAKFRVGRYHSLYIHQDQLPNELIATAITDDGVMMAIEHRQLPIAAVQFHPESIMSLEGEVGEKIIEQMALALLD